MKFWRQRKDEELDAEIRSHLDEAIRDRIARGESPDEARANALREFGNVGLVKEVTGALALVLAALGIYGVLAFSVTQRTREIGIRMALGAQASNVQMLVVRQAMTLVMLGIAIGLPCAIAVAHVLRSLLLGLSATDPLAYSGVALLLFIVALVASWMPARRAAQIDPMIALRHE